MSRDRNLLTVIRFEVTRALAKRSFWFATLAVPVAIGIVMALQIGASSSASDQTAEQSTARFGFSYVDDSGLVDAQVATAAGGTRIEDAAAGVEQVREGKLDAFFHFPADPTSQPIQVAGQDVGIFNSGKYEAVARAILVSSATAKIGDAKLAALSAGTVSAETTTYKDGAKSGGVNEMIPGLLFPVVFFLALILLGNQMLTSTLEEKENRVTEMILTTIEPTRLIIGKIVSLFVVGLVQFLVFAVPTVVGYLSFRDRLKMPSIDLSALVFSPEQLIVGALLLLGGFSLLAGTLVALGAIMPTAKDAGPIYGTMMILTMMPLYAIALIVSDPNALLVQVFTWFPYSAPMTAMLRNALGNLPLGTAVVVISWLFVLAAVSILAAVRLFKYGSLAYTERLSLRVLIRRGGSRPEG